jgi:hypothetical protein
VVVSRHFDDEVDIAASPTVPPPISTNVIAVERRMAAS